MLTVDTVGETCKGAFARCDSRIRLEAKEVEQPDDGALCGRCQNIDARNPITCPCRGDIRPLKLPRGVPLHGYVGCM